MPKLMPDGSLPCLHLQDAGRSAPARDRDGLSLHPGAAPTALNEQGAADGMTAARQDDRWGVALRATPPKLDAVSWPQAAPNTQTLSRRMLEHDRIRLSDLIDKHARKNTG